MKDGCIVEREARWKKFSEPREFLYYKWQRLCDCVGLCVVHECFPYVNHTPSWFFSFEAEFLEPKLIIEETASTAFKKVTMDSQYGGHPEDLRQLQFGLPFASCNVYSGEISWIKVFRLRIPLMRIPPIDGRFGALWCK